MAHLEHLFTIQLLLFVFSCTTEGVFIRPDRHTLPDGLQSLSGSDANGGCVMQCINNEQCQCPDGVQVNSTLIDGVCPTSVDTTDPNFASDFFTISRNGDNPVLIGFRWPTSFVLRGVELKLLNCPTLFTGIRTINVWRSGSYPGLSTVSSVLVGSYESNVNDKSCSDVMTIVITTDTDTSSIRNYFIEFVFPPGDSNTGVYIAETRFSDTLIVVPEVVSSSPPPPVVSSTPQQPTPPVSSTPSPAMITTSRSDSTAMMSFSNTAIFVTPASTASLVQTETSELIRMSTTALELTSTPLPTTLQMPTTAPPIETTPMATPPAVVTTIPPASSSPIGAIVGSLSVIIVLLLVVIAVGVCVGYFLNKKWRKSDIRHLQHAISESNESVHEMNPRYSFANNQYYEDTVHRRGDGTMTTNGYSDVDFATSTEPLYHTVGNNKLRSAAIPTEEESYYDAIRDTDGKPVPPYTKVKVSEPPLVPKKTPELYRQLRIEAETDSSTIPGVVVFDDNGSEIETVDNENSYEKFADNASVHSGLSPLTKPVLSMDSNPTYESPDLDLPQSKQEPTDRMYANPDAIDEDRSPKDDGTYTDTIPPPKPSRSRNPSLTEADDVYTDIDKDAKPDKVENVIYTDPDAPLKPTVEEDIYTNPDLGEEIIYSEAADPLPITKPPPTQDGTYSLPDDDPYDIYTDPDARRAHFDHLPAIYDTTYQESTIASIFDPDSVPPVYENTISDEDLFPYAPLYTDLPTASEKIVELTSDNIRRIKVLGSGCFGQVVLAETINLSPKDLKMSSTDDDKTKSIKVAVKTLKATASSSTKESFEKECKFMSRLDHPHVISFLGVCKTDTPYIMMEYLQHGDLNTYLQEIDSIVDFDTQNPAEISRKILVRMCAQISDAMNYLASRNYIHRDLAARNCLVGENNVVKLSDFGMSRSLYESHYYIIKGRAVLPVRWMASECFYGKFSVNSDIWAFGVTMWEIFTLTKELPYKDMSDSEVAADARKGPKRQPLSQPASCPREVYDVMQKCWAYLPRARATFDELFKELSSLISDN